MSVIELGESIPPLTPHAASVSLPAWRDNVGYEEGEERVLSRMKTGYPRFFIHKSIASFAAEVVRQHGHSDQQAMLFPSNKTARRCVSFMQSRETVLPARQPQVIDFVLDTTRVNSATLTKIAPSISAVLFPIDQFPLAKQYWQHSGDGISSRRAEFCHGLWRDGILMTPKDTPINGSMNGIINGSPKACKGPRRYQRASSDMTPRTQHERTPSSEVDQSPSVIKPSENGESSQFLEERYGRNLDISFVRSAHSAIRRRITGSLSGDAEIPAEPQTTSSSNVRGVSGLTEEDVFLYPCGMNAIFVTHQMMMKSRGPLKSISFGFPYVDTLKILEKFGPGVLFYGNGASEDLDDLERRLEAGERYLALFCEFPGNPMLKCPDLERIRQLADQYDFAVVIDETIGNFINVNVLPFADVVVSSLTKIFSGDCNVMGGCSIFHPDGRYYQTLKEIANTEYEDNYWAEDILFMERNSRDYVSRIERINKNAELICSVLRAHPLVKALYYPKHNPSRVFYDACRTSKGGYGGLLSFELQTKAQAAAFYDRIETAKGPSLGTNFTITSPYVILAHYMELNWAAQFGVAADLIRVSVGLEDAEDLKQRFIVALHAAEEAES